MANTIDIRQFEPKYRSSLIFSIFEGLIPGRSLRLVFDEQPTDLENQFKTLKLDNLDWKTNRLDHNIWELVLIKNEIKDQDSCCGVCGGAGHSRTS